MSMIGLSLPATALMHRGRSYMPPEALALVGRMAVHPSDTRIGLIGRLVQGLKIAGIWQKLDALYLLAAHDAQAARLNWIQDAHNLTAVASPGFLVDRGYASDGTSSYLDMNLNPRSAGLKYAQDSASIGVWSLTDVDTLACAMGQVSSYLILKVGNLFYANLNRQAIANNTVTSASSIGLRAASRLSSSQSRSFINGGPAGTFEVPSFAPDNWNYVLLARSIGPSNANLFDVHRFAMAFLGGGLSDAEMAALHAEVGKYLSAVGAI